MAVAHVCISCGTSLTRIRPGLDPHYGLRVVVCPGCGTACVRRRDPLVAGWRRFREIHRSLRQVVFLPLAAWALLAGAIFGAALTLDLLRALNSSWTGLHGDLLSGRAMAWRIPDWMRGSGEPFSPIVLVIFAFAAGLVLAFGLSHWRRWALIPLWLGMWNLAVFMPLILRVAGTMIDTVAAAAFGESVLVGSVRSRPDLTSIYDLSAAAFYSLPVFVIGVVSASPARRLAGVNASRRWRKRRRLLQRKRESR